MIIKVFILSTFWFLTTSAFDEVLFDQKLYMVFLGDSIVLTLNFSSPPIHQSYERFQLSVGNLSILTCERRLSTSVNPRCSTHNEHLFLCNNPTMRGDRMDVRVDNVTFEMGDRIVAVFKSSADTYTAIADVVVLDEPTCNSSYLLYSSRNGPERRTTRFVPISEDTEINENTAVKVECSINSYHKSRKIPAFPSWKSTTAILLKMSNRVKYQTPLLSMQSATLVVNRISHFDSIHCEVLVPNCLPGQAGCRFFPNVTEGHEEDFVDYDVYPVDEDDDDGRYLDDDDVRKSSMCLKNSRKCKCFLKRPKLTYCADEVIIVQEKLPSGSFKLTCMVKSSPPSNLVWESSDPTFKVSRESTIIVNTTAIYSCRASLPGNRDIQCEVRFKTIDLKDYAGSEYTVQIIAGVALTFLGLLCLSSILFIAKGVVENNKRDKIERTTTTDHGSLDY